MNSFAWSRAVPHEDIRRIPAEGPVYVISDLHIGDGSRSDIFLAKDKDLLRFLAQVTDEGATLVIAGDAIDFSQAWAFGRVLKAHGKLFWALRQLAEEGHLLYVYGNHDHDMRFYKDMLSFPVVAGVEIGDQVKIIHGHELDPEIGPNLRESELATMVHHLFERVLRTWLRVPLELFYTRSNRLMFYVGHKALLWQRFTGWLLSPLDGGTRKARAEDRAAYWIRSNMGDPGCLFHPAMARLTTQEQPVLICGHSHLPGVVRRSDGRVYANTGSWTFASASYLKWTPEDGPVVQDWLTGRVWESELYQPLLRGDYDHKTIDDWWREHYMGLFRFRCGEERRGKLPPWKPRRLPQPPQANP
jgi:UDP-2,3-diacylglucosamine pyrophosphatase LpxH